MPSRRMKSRWCPIELAVTLGAKVEHNETTGLAVQPSARIWWQPRRHQVIWSAVSRAVRTPSMAELAVVQHGGRCRGPGSASSMRSSETPTWWRKRSSATSSGLSHKPALDPVVRRRRVRAPSTTTSSGRASPRRSSSSRPPPHAVLEYQVENGAGATTAGLEVLGVRQPVRRWRAQAAYTWFHSNQDMWSGGGATVHQMSVRSLLTLAPGVEFEGFVYPWARSPRPRSPRPSRTSSGSSGSARRICAWAGDATRVELTPASRACSRAPPRVSPTGSSDCRPRCAAACTCAARSGY